MEEKQYKKSKTFGTEEDNLIKVNSEKSGYESLLSCCGNLSGCCRTWFPCCCCCCAYPYYPVSQGEVGLLQEFGRFQHILQPGFHRINPCSDSVEIVSLKTFQLEITDAVVLTKDNITLSVDIVLYYRVVNPIKAFYRISNITGAIREVTQSVVRNIFGEYAIQELLNDRLKISEDLLESIESLISEWGIYIEKTFIKDFQLSRELQSGLALAGKVKKETEAKIINAQANIEVAKLQKQVSDVLNNEAAMQIRFLQTLGEITQSPSKKVVMMRM